MVAFSVRTSACELKKFNLIHSKNGQSISFRGRILVPIVLVPGYCLPFTLNVLLVKIQNLFKLLVKLFNLDKGQFWP